MPTKPAPTAKPLPVDMEALVAALAPRVTAIVLGQLAAALGTVEAPYSTRDGDTHAPPEYRGRAKRWRRDAPGIPGAARVGRWWSVPRGAYASWLASQSTTAPMPMPVATTQANDSPAAPWTPAGALASVGLRASR